MIPWSSRFLKLMGIDIQRLSMNWSSSGHMAIAYTLNKYLTSINTTYTIKDPYILAYPDSMRNHNHWADDEAALDVLYSEMMNDMPAYEALHIIHDLAQPLHTVAMTLGGYEQQANEYRPGNVNDEFHNMTDKLIDRAVSNLKNTEIVVPTLSTEDFHAELLALWQTSHDIAINEITANHVQMSTETALSRYKYGIAVCKLFLKTKYQGDTGATADVIGGAGKVPAKPKITTAKDEIGTGEDASSDPADTELFDFPAFDDSYTIADLDNKIAQSAFDNYSETYTLPPKYLVDTCETEIKRMMNNESLLRIGDIWFGKDKYSTVTGFSLFSNKQISTVQPLRTDLALSLSTSMSPVDSVQIEVICHVSKMQSVIQRLAIMTEITPVLPMMNPALAALLLPMVQNKRIYEAYGFNTEELCDPSADMKEQIRAYASTPVFVHIDSINLSYAGPRDIRMLIPITRVMTGNSYGDRVLYCQTMDDSYRQHMYMKKFISGNKDTDQVKMYGSIFGLYNEEMREMVDAITKIPTNQSDNYAPYEAYIWDIIDGDTLDVYPTGGNGVYPVKSDPTNASGVSRIRLFGIDAPEGEAFSEYINFIPTTEMEYRGSEKSSRQVAPVAVSIQRFSREAKAKLMHLTGFNAKSKDKPVRIIVQPYGYDSTEYRMLAEVYVPTTQSAICVNYELVKEGLAYVYTDNTRKDEQTIRSLKKYYTAQSEAKKKGIGIWSQPEDEREIPSAFRNRIRESIQYNTHKWRFQN